MNCSGIIDLHGTSGPNYHLTNVYGGDANLVYDTKVSKTVIGAEVYDENILSNVLGNLMSGPIWVNWDPQAVYTRMADRYNVNLYAEQSLIIKKFTLSAGLLSYWNSDYGWKESPGIDLSYQLFNNTRLFADVNHSVRIPSFTELYYSDPVHIANPDLKPEEITTYEIGARYLSRYTETDFSFYVNDGTNMIDWVKNSPDSVKWESKNLTQINTTGFGISTNLDFKKIFRSNFPLSALKVSYSYMDMSKSSGNYISYYVLDYLKNKVTIKLDINIYKNILGSSIYYSWQDRAGTFVDYPSMLERTYPQVNSLDLRIYWQKKYIFLFVDVTNVLNETMYSYGEVILPGRWIKAGISYKIM